MEKAKKNEKFVSATVPCDNCGAPIAYYDGKTLCDECAGVAKTATLAEVIYGTAKEWSEADI